MSCARFIVYPQDNYEYFIITLGLQAIELLSIYVYLIQGRDIIYPALSAFKREEKPGLFTYR